MSNRRLVGAWTTRSDNGVDVFLEGGLAGEGTIACEWDCWPLPAADAEEWATRILPEMIAHVAALIERPGPILVIRS